MIDHLTAHASTFAATTMGKLFKEVHLDNTVLKSCHQRKEYAEFSDVLTNDRTVWSKAVPVDLVFISGGEDVIACFERATGTHLNKPG